MLGDHRHRDRVTVIEDANVRGDPQSVVPVEQRDERGGLADQHGAQLAPGSPDRAAQFGLDLIQVMEGEPYRLGEIRDVPVYPGHEVFPRTGHDLRPELRCDIGKPCAHDVRQDQRQYHFTSLRDPGVRQVRAERRVRHGPM